MYQLMMLVVDGVQTDLRITVHASFSNDTLRTEVQLLGLVVVKYVAERWHIVEGAIEIEGILLRLEIQYLTHLLVHGQQTARLVVESQTDQSLLEDLTVAVCQLLLLPFHLHLVCQIGQSTEDVGRLFLVRVGKLSDSQVVNIAPFPFMLVLAGIPAEGAVGYLLTINKALYKG